MLENKAEELINNQDHFWEKYINFLDNYPTDDTQIANIRLIYPTYEVYQEMTFTQQVNHIKEKSPLMLQISNPDAESLVPENIEGLSATYEDIIATLTKIGGLEDNRNVKNERKSKIITKDVDDLITKIIFHTSPTDNLKITTRKLLINEVDQLLRRIDILKMDEFEIPAEKREKLQLLKTVLVEKQDEAEADKRKAEHLEKARAQESIKSAQQVSYKNSLDFRTGYPGISK